MVKIIENYTLMQMIGSGVYGKVYRSTHAKNNNLYAIKIIPIKTFKDIPKLQQCSTNQINTLKSLETCENIVHFVEILKTQNNCYFVYEYCNGGTLEKILKQQKRLSQTQAIQYFKQLLNAFKVLQAYRVIHRDLKPDNIFLNNGVLKLGDFGFCKNLQNDNSMTSTMLGSPLYMAPQILKGKDYTSKADIWSLGVVLFQMLFGYCPFQSNSIANLICMLQQSPLKFPSDCTISGKTQNILKKMLVKQVNNRIQWNQIFNEFLEQQKSKQSKRSQSLNKQWQPLKMKSENIVKQIQIQHQNVSSRVINIKNRTIGDQYMKLPPKHKSISHKKTVSSVPGKNSEQKSELIFKQQHHICTVAINLAIQLIDTNQNLKKEQYFSCLQVSYLILQKIYDKLSKITGVQNEIFINVRKKQCQQVQKIMVNIKQELKVNPKHIVPLFELKTGQKQNARLKIILSDKYRDLMGSKKVFRSNIWCQIINFLMRTNCNNKEDVQLILGIKKQQLN